MPELIEEPIQAEKVALVTPVVIPEQAITDIRVQFLSYTYHGLDAAEGVVKRIDRVINTKKLLENPALLAELEKDAKTDVVNVTG